MIDGLDIILPEGFTKAVLTIVADIDHYEVTLLAQDELEAAAGDYSVALDLSEAGLDEDRIYKVEIDQAPATEEQVAAVEAALSEELEGGIRKIAHVSDLEMVDISIIDIQTGEAVEPSGPVAVELKKGGETVPTVVHFKGDGSVETLEVEDGRFVTESFSEFTGSYTVDFEYNTNVNDAEVDAVQSIYFVTSNSELGVYYIVHANSIENGGSILGNPVTISNDYTTLAITKRVEYKHTANVQIEQGISTDNLYVLFIPEPCL